MKRAEPAASSDASNQADEGSSRSTSRRTGTGRDRRREREQALEEHRKPAQAPPWPRRNQLRLHGRHVVRSGARGARPRSACGRSKARAGSVESWRGSTPRVAHAADAGPTGAGSRSAAPPAGSIGIGIQSAPLGAGPAGTALPSLPGGDRGPSPGPRPDWPEVGIGAPSPFRQTAMSNSSASTPAKYSRRTAEPSRRPVSTRTSRCRRNRSAWIGPQRQAGVRRRRREPDAGSRVRPAAVRCAAVEEGQDPRCRLLPPYQAAQVGLQRSKSRGRCMPARASPTIDVQRSASGARRGGRAGGRRAAGVRAPRRDLASAIGVGSERQVPRCEVLHQVQVEGSCPPSGARTASDTVAARRRRQK